MDDDRALKKLTLKLMAGRDEGLTTQYNMYKRENYTENELAPRRRSLTDAYAYYQIQLAYNKISF